jgi:flagellar motor switch protein FliN
MTSAPYHWIKTIEEVVAGQLSGPLWGNPPPFPWDEIADKLKEKLALPSLKLSLKKSEWLSKEQLFSGMGSPLILEIAVMPLNETLQWAIPKEALPSLTHRLLSPDSPAKFSDVRFQEGFTRFFALEILSTLNDEAAFGDLLLALAPPTSHHHSGALCLDIAMALGNETIWSRLICPPSFQKAFKEHFAYGSKPVVQSSLAKTVDLPLRLEVGSVTLNFHDWKKAAVGDCLLLDHCSFDPVEHKGSARLVLEQLPLFHVKLKKDEVKVLDYIFYQEENMDSDLPEDHPLDEPEDKIPFEEEHPEQERREEEAEEETYYEAEEEEIAPAPETSEELAVENPSLEKLVKADAIPLVLTVEIARLQMNLEKLMGLEAGSVLDLTVKPEQGVYLTVNGKPVAKGELIKIGETLGVKILHMA